MQIWSLSTVFLVLRGCGRIHSEQYSSTPAPWSPRQLAPLLCSSLLLPVAPRPRPELQRRCWVTPCCLPLAAEPQRHRWVQALYSPVPATRSSPHAQIPARLLVTRADALRPCAAAADVGGLDAIVKGGGVW
jgi:hypothetical protein